MEADGEDIISRLPIECTSRVLSLTSPLDAVRSALVSKTFKSASESDAVWRRFLPPDWEDIISRSVTPVEFSSIKELYFRLCGSIIIDDGRMIFSVDKMTGKKCFVLPAGELTILWDGSPQYWMWATGHRSRPGKVVVFRTVCWLEISGHIGSHMLSPNTTYTAYLVMGYDEHVRGLDHTPADVSVRLGNQVSQHTASLQSKEHAGNAADDARIPQPRSDGWVEIELGECYHEEGDEGEVRMSLTKTNGGQWMGGIVVEGIEIRPKGSPIV